MGNKLAVVTGAGRGIGFGIALRMAQAGYDIVGTYRNTPDGAQLMQEKVEALGRTCKIYRCDISVMEDIYAFWEAFRKDYGRLDVLINNAGVTKFAPFLEMTEETWSIVNHTDWRGTFFMAQQGAKIMVENKTPGVIINISSNHMTGCWPGATAYSGAKAALSKFATNAGMELSKYGIRVNTIAPGYTTNGKYWEASTLTPEQQKGRKETMEKIPLQRFCTPEEVGGACVFLASDDAAYMTGATIVMDGGALLPNLPSFRGF